MNKIKIKKDVINWIRRNFDGTEDFYGFLKYIDNKDYVKDLVHEKYSDLYLELKSFPEIEFRSSNGNFIMKPFEWVYNNYRDNKTKRYSIFNIRAKDGSVRSSPIENRKTSYPFISYLGKKICGWTFVRSFSDINKQLYEFQRYNQEKEMIETKYLKFKEVRALLKQAREQGEDI